LALRLPRFNHAVPLTNEDGTPQFAFHVWNDQFASAIESAVTDLSSAITAIAAAQAAADAAQADATSALNQLTDIASDNLLTPGEKPVVIKDYTAITNDQSDLDTKATLYGITTEKTNYDNAISALTTYLATLTTPVLWSDLTGNTTIVGSTFRSKFLDVYSTKQLLINKITASAKTLADNAQSTANTATTDAATAQGTANTANTTANTVKRDDKIGGSSVIPADVLTASDAGTDATVVVAAHTRLYNDNSSLSVGGHTFTGLAYSTSYGVYYDDTTTSDTTPTYHTTTTLSHALNNFVAGRHYVGIVTTPASGGSPTTGGSTPIGTDTADRSQLSSV
jgi:hypothetical protein